MIERFIVFYSVYVEKELGGVRAQAAKIDLASYSLSYPLSHGT